MRFIRNTAFFLCLLAMTACFDVIDEISLNADGSGEYMLTLNLSKSRSRVASIMLMDSIRGIRVPSKEEIRLEILKFADFFDRQEGITDVTHVIDFENYIFKIGFHFESVDNINSAIDKLIVANEKGVKPFYLRYDYDRENQTFSRLYEAPEANEKNFEKLSEEDRGFLNEAIYISIYRFPDEVERVTNRRARISGSGKAVMLRSSATDLFRGSTDLTNTIHLK